MSFLDLFYPKYCYVCNKQGDYLCYQCKKLFKRNLPECYICRRISNGFNTHRKDCLKNNMDRVFVCWEYNKITSAIMRKLKYGQVTDASKVLFPFFNECLSSSCFSKFLNSTLLIPVPISNQRMRDRGFNQSELLAKSLSKNFALDMNNRLVFRKNDNLHQASHSHEARLEIYRAYNPFYIRKKNDILSSYQSLTIVDDVMTTGSTLNSVHKCLIKEYPDISIQAICMFRGKRRY